MSNRIVAISIVISRLLAPALTPSPSPAPLLPLVPLFPPSVPLKKGETSGCFAFCSMGEASGCFAFVARERGARGVIEQGARL
jgi:hypothetical protein